MRMEDLKEWKYIPFIILIALGFYLFFTPPALSEAGFASLLDNPKASLFVGMPLDTLKVLLLALHLLSCIFLFVFLKKEGGELPAFVVSILLLLTPAVLNNFVFLSSPLEEGAFFFLSLGLLVLSYEKFAPASALPFLAAAFFHPIYGMAAFVLSGYKLLLSKNRLLVIAIITSLSFIVLGPVPELSITLSGISLLFVLGSLSLIGINNLKMRPSALLFVAGIAISLVASAAGAVVLAAAAVNAVQDFLSDNPENKRFMWVLLVFFLSVFLLLKEPEPAKIVFMAGFITLMVYALLSLYNFSRNLAYLFLMLLVMFAFFHSFFALFFFPEASPSAELLGAFQWIRESQPTARIAVLGFNSSFRYMTGMEPVVLAPETLLKNESPDAAYLLLSHQTLQSAFDAKPIVFRYSGRYSQEKKDYAIFQGRYYLMAVLLADSEFSLESARIVAIDGSPAGTVPFNRLKLYEKNLSYDNPHNLLINTEGLENTMLYTAIFKKEPLYSNGGVKLVKLT